jgi:hypothetical protein
MTEGPPRRSSHPWAVEYGTHVYRASRYAFEFQLLARP